MERMEEEALVIDEIKNMYGNIHMKARMVNLFSKENIFERQNEIIC